MAFTGGGSGEVLPGGDEVLVEDVQDVLADVSQLLLHLGTRVKDISSNITFVDSNSSVWLKIV